MTKRRIWFELAIVLALSVGAAAAYSVLDLLAALTAPSGIGGQTTSLNPTLDSRQWLDIAYQTLRQILSFAPVALVVYLLSVQGSALKELGISTKAPGRASATGVGLAALIGIPGIGLYLLARSLNLSVKIVASDLQNHWYSIPILIIAAASAAVVEETIVVGYLFERLGRLGWKSSSIILTSALLRASYHLYQGFGGFVGNLAMGLVFALFFRKTNRLVPLLIAHFLLDAFSFIGYPLVAHLLP